MPLDLNQLARDLLDAGPPQWAGAAADGIAELVLEPGEIPKVMGLAGRLREVLVALILNAVEAMPGGGRIVVRTWATPEAVHCAVVDTGPGVSDEVRHRALEPFFTTKGPRHQGLGLSMAHGIIRRHRGEIEISSDGGHGTIVAFHLPREDREATAIDRG